MEKRKAIHPQKPHVTSQPSIWLLVGVSCLLCSLAVPGVWNFLRVKTLQQTLSAAPRLAQRPITVIEIIEIIYGRANFGKAGSDLPDVLKGLRRPE